MNTPPKLTEKQAVDAISHLYASRAIAEIAFRIRGNDFAAIEAARDAQWLEHIKSIEAQRDELEARKDAAYLERNKLVALLSKLFPAGKKKTAIDGWSEDWHGCVYIDLPTGQASWHYHDSHAYLFDHLPKYESVWDGHTTDEKYARIAKVQASEPAPKREWVDPTDKQIEAAVLVDAVNGTDWTLTACRAALKLSKELNHGG